MRKFFAGMFLSLAGVAQAGQGCLHVMGDVNGVFCPKCSDPGASSLARAIPLALHMERAEYERLAALDPAAAVTMATMLWRGDEGGMIDARTYSAQYKALPTREYALGMYDHYEQFIALPFGTSLPGRDFLHVEATGERLGDFIRLTLQTLLDSNGTRAPVSDPIELDIHLTRDEVAASFGGQLVTAPHGWATFP